MPTKQQIEGRIKQLNSDIDAIIDSGLLRDIERYQSSYERSINKIAFDEIDGRFRKTSRNFDKVLQLEARLQVEFNELSATHFKLYTDVGKQSFGFVAFTGVESGIKFSDLTVISKLKTLDFAIWFGKGRELDSLVKRQLVNAIATGASIKTAKERLAIDLLGAGGKTGLLARHADTYMRTALFSLNNSVDKQIYDTAGGGKADAEYIYAGPIDGRNRPFCAKNAWRTFTLSEISKFPTLNGSGMDPFYIAPGGWNCRHKLILNNPKINIQ